MRLKINEVSEGRPHKESQESATKNIVLLFKQKMAKMRNHEGRRRTMRRRGSGVSDDYEVCTGPLNLTTRANAYFD